MATQQAAYDFLMTGDHEQVIYAVLKHLYLTPTHPDFEDYLQEGRLLFIAAYQRFPDDPVTHPHQFLKWAYRRIGWGLRDQLRRQRHQEEHHEPGDQTTQLGELAALDDLEAAVSRRDFREFLLQLIAEAGVQGEWRYLTGILREHLTVAEIATKYGVSPQTVYKWRQRTIKRLVRELR